jgi:hypothetical protein
VLREEGQSDRVGTGRDRVSQPGGSSTALPRTSTSPEEGGTHSATLAALASLRSRPPSPPSGVWVGFAEEGNSVVRRVDGTMFVARALLKQRTVT